MVVGSALQTLNQAQKIAKFFISGTTLKKAPIVKIKDPENGVMGKDEKVLFSLEDPVNLSYVIENVPDSDTPGKNGNFINISV